MPREVYRLADLTLDVGAAAVWREGGRLELPQLSFDLLVALTRHAPDVVSAEDLIAEVWAGVAVSDETLTQRVALLRRALGDDARTPRYLRAVRGRGYQLAPPVEALAETPGAPARPRPRWLPGLLGLALAATAVGLLARGLWHEQRPTATAAPAPLATRPLGAGELVARAGTYLARHQEADNELAIELYRKALALDPEHADALAGLSLALSQRTTKFNRPYADVEQALLLARRALERDPRLPRAHHALGLALDGQGRISDAIAAYRRAWELDPSQPAPLASLAHLLTVRGELAEALEADVRAGPGGEALPYLEVQIGTVLSLLGFETAGETWLVRAAELRPDSVFAAAALAQAQLSRGRLREADSVAADALGRGIRRTELALVRGRVALLEGEPEAAAAFFRRAREIHQGQPEAEARLLLLERTAAGSPGAGTEPRRRELLAGLRAGREDGDEWPDGAYVEALLHAGWSDLAEAQKALDHAIELGFRDAGWLRRDPDLAPLGAAGLLAGPLARIEALIAAQRQRVLGAPWLPLDLLAGSTASK